MKQGKPQRKSYCTLCGKRLSHKTSSGAIVWDSSRVDDKGIYCETCKAPLKIRDNGKNNRESR